MTAGANGATTSRSPVTIVGIGDDGCVGLSSRAVNAVVSAGVLVGGERQLAFFPQFRGHRIVVSGGLTKVLDEIEVLSEDNNVCVLASGDPMFFGIGELVVRRVGTGRVNVIPQPSSPQLAFARVGIKWDDADLISLHARALDGLCSRLRHVHKVALLTDPTNTPQRIARHLREYNNEHWRAWVCENLGGVEECVREFSLAELSNAADFSPLNVVVLVRTTELSNTVIPHFDEALFAKRVPKLGLITKREVRVLSLARLNLRQRSVMWDVGAGSGAVGIEVSMIATHGHVYAVEIDEECVAMCRENARVFGADNVQVIEGRAPEALSELPAPDAVFVGGSKGSLREIMARAWSVLNPDGAMVVNAITLENVAEAYAGFKELGLTPEITLLQVARSAPVGPYQRYDALNPIHIFSARKGSAQ